MFHLIETALIEFVIVDRKGVDIQTPPRTRGMKYAARNGNINMRWTTVAIPNSAINAYPAVSEGVYG
jgi:hypothetical protein